MTNCTIGIVGAGGVVNDLHLPVIQNLPLAQVGWITDANHEQSRSTARAYGLKCVRLPDDPSDLPDCDVVLLAVPVSVRAPYYAAFAKRGTPVFAEKPLAMNAAEHRRLLQEFGSGQLACGFIRRLYESTEVARSLLDSGILGVPLCFRVRESKLVMKTGRGSTYLDGPSSRGGGFTFDIGCHGLDLGLYLARATGFKVVRRRIVWDGETDREIEACLELTTKGNECPILDYRGGWLGPDESGFEIEFASARVQFAMVPGAAVRLTGANSNVKRLTIHHEPRGASTMSQAGYLEWIQFLDGWQHAAASDIDAATCVLTTQAIEELLKKEPGL